MTGALRPPRARASLGVALLLVPLACAAEDPSGDASGGTGARGGADDSAGDAGASRGGTSGGSGGSSGASGSGGSAGGSGNAGGAGNAGAPDNAGGAGVGEAGMGGAAGSAGDGGLPFLPCDVEDVIQAKCQRCHAEPQRNGAPFPLLVWADTRLDYNAQVVHERMIPAIETDFMPLTELALDPPVQPLTADEKALLLGWLRAGALPAFDVDCD